MFFVQCILVSSVAIGCTIRIAFHFVVVFASIGILVFNKSNLSVEGDFYLKN